MMVAIESTDPNTVVPLNYEWIPTGMDLTVLKIPENKFPKALGHDPKKNKIISSD
jgi:hypothetical protein